MKTNNQIGIDETLILDLEGNDHEFIFVTHTLFSDEAEYEAHVNDPIILGKRIFNSWDTVNSLYEKACKARKRSSHYKRHIQDCYLLADALGLFAAEAA